MNQLYLLDAYAIIYRSYYAFIRNPRINSQGKNTSAIYGFVNMLSEISNLSPTHFAVAFDPAGGHTFRREMYAPYKAQRDITPEVIRESVPIIKDIIRAMNIPILEVANYEADDVIGTASRMFDTPDTRIYMITPDKDYAQLVDERVHMLKPRSGAGFEDMGPEEVRSRYDIASPAQVIDLLGLMGDSADNIPGCPGVGPGKATKLLKDYGSIEGIIAHSDEIKGALGRNIRDNVEQIRLSRDLAEIRRDIPLPCSLDDLRVKEPDTGELRKIYEQLEFKTFLKKLLPAGQQNAGPERSLFDGLMEQNEGPKKTENAAPDPAAPTENQNEATLASIKTTPHEYYLVESEEEMRKLCAKILSGKIVSLDTETTSSEAMKAELVGLSFSTEEGLAWYVPVPAEKEAAQRVVEVFRPVYESDLLKVGQNIKYDIIVLSHYGIHVRGKLWDTMIAHYILQPELPHNMDDLAEHYLHYTTVHITELIGPKGKDQKNMRSLEPAAVKDYAAEDADITLRLYNVLRGEVAKGNMTSLLEDVEMPLVQVLAAMETAGVRIDTESLGETSRLYTERMNTYEKQVQEMAGEKFNISSPRQVGQILFEKLQLDPRAKKTKTGQYSTTEEVLEKLRNRSPIVDLILKYRGMKKLISTYLDALPRLINPLTGKIHTSFNQTITATGRLSSSNPNLQNIPVRGDDGKEIRKAFIPDDGCSFFSADYSQIELRIMAHFSGDEHMRNAFIHGEDIHAATAAKIWHKAISEVTPDERRKAKTANFGIIYGISPFGLSERLNIPRTEAKELIDNYFTEYPKIQDYIERSISEARAQGYIETILHRRRYLPDINSGNAVVRGYAERNAVNAPIQGSAADIIKIAMVRIYRRFTEEGLRSQMILQVHDELNFNVYPDERERVQEIVIHEMENAYPLSVPLRADFGWGANWLEAH